MPNIYIQSSTLEDGTKNPIVDINTILISGDGFTPLYAFSLSIQMDETNNNYNFNADNNGSLQFILNLDSQQLIDAFNGFVSASFNKDGSNWSVQNGNAYIQLVPA